MHSGRDNRSNVRRSVLSCTLLVATVATLIAGSAQMGTYAEAATPVTLQSAGPKSLTGGYSLLSSRLDIIGAYKKSGAKRKSVSNGGLQLFQASENNTNEITFVEESSVDGGYVEEFHGDGTYIEEFHGDGSQTDTGGGNGNDNVVVIGDGGAGDGVEVVMPDETDAPDVNKEEHANDSQTHEWPVTRTQTVSDSEDKSYTVTVTFGEDAGIPHEAELKVSTSDATESRVSSQHAAVSLGSDEFAVADWFLDVALEHDGQVCVPIGTVEVVVDTDAIDPSLSDAVEVVVSSSVQASENQSGSAAKGHSSFKFSADQLGEIGFTVVERKSTEIKVLDSTIVVWAPRSVSVKAKESFDIPDTLPSEGIAKIGTLKLSVDPSRSWPTNLYVTSERSSQSSLKDGLILSVEGEDTSLFGIEGTEEPVEVSDEGTYLVEWDTGCRDAAVNSGDVEVKGPLPIGVEFEAADVRADYSDAESVTGITDGVKYGYDVIGAHDLSFSVGQSEWKPDKVHKEQVTIRNIPVGVDHDVQVWHLEDDRFQQVEEVTFTDEGVSFFAADDGTYVLIDKVSLERVFTATDDETYRMTVTYDGSACLPRDVYLEVTSLATEGPDYLMSMVESAKSLGSAAKHVAYAQMYDIALVDPFTGVRHRPSEGVTIEVELLSAEVGTEDSLGVVNLGSDAIPVASATDGSTVDFDADGATTYAIVVTAVEKAVTASDGKTYEITVTYDSASGIPAGATLEVTEIVDGDEGYEEYVAKSAEKLGATTQDVALAKAFDITLRDPESGEEYQPTKDVVVSVELLQDDLNEYTSVDVVHINGESAGEAGEAEVMNSAIRGETVEFVTDGFSVYVLMGFTVDFHWGDYSWSIEGESEVRLSEVFERLGVTEIALADVVDASFSDPELVEVTKIEGDEERETDWLLKSLAPFNTEEVLTLALSNGRVVEIKVTDSQGDNNVYDNSDNVIGSWELSPEGTLTISATGAMKDYSTGNFVKDTPWFYCINGESSPAKKVVFSDGITRIGTNSFTRSYNLTEIDASNCTSLQTIGTSAFKQSSGGTPHNQNNPKVVNFSGCENLATIEDSAFIDCKGIEQVDISGTRLASSAIVDGRKGFGSSKTKLQILIANNCTQITGALNLSGYTSLTRLELSGCAGITSLNLNNCPALTTLVVSGCTGLTSLTVPSSVTALDVTGSGLTTLDVSNCTDLTSLSVSSGVKTLKANGSGLTSLDLSACANLTSLDATGCVDLTSLDLSACAKLNSLVVSDSITDLNIEGTTLSPAIASLKDSLETLTMSATNAKDADLTGFANLKTIYFMGSEDDLEGMGIKALPDVDIILPDDQKMPLTVTAGEVTKTYDGNRSVNIDASDAYQVTGLKDGHVIDSLVLTSGQSGVGTHVLTASDAKVVDGDGNNVTSRYAITYEPGTLTIEPAPVKVTANDARKERGSEDPALTAVVTGLVGEDESKIITYTLSRAEGEAAGKHAITPVGEARQGNYSVTYVPGTLTIVIPVTVTADTKHKVYGEKDNLTAQVSGLEEGDTIEYGLTRVSGENVGEYTVTPIGNETQDYYSVAYQTGKLIIDPKVVTVKANDLSKTYGNADPVLTASVTELMGSDKVAYTLSRVAGERVGTIYSVSPTYIDIQGNYIVTGEDGNFTINKKPLIITADSGSRSYDGNALTKNSYTHTSLADGDRIESVTVTGTQTKVGASLNVPSAAKIVNADGEDVTDCYDITYQDGVLLVTGAEGKSVLITADSGSRSYDGNALTKNNYTHTSLADGDRIESVTVTGTQTKVGASLNVPSAAKIVNEAGEDVTDSYEIAYANGTLEVTQRSLTITADSDNKVYDGKALTKETYTAYGLIESDTVDTVTITGSQTVRGTTNNIPSGARIIDTNKKDVTDQYDITYISGKLEVTKRSIAIIADSDEKFYDKAPLTKDSYLWPDDIVPTDRIESVEIAGSQTVVGKSDNVPSNAKIVNEDGEDVTASYDITYVEGTLEVKQKNVLVSADNKSKTYGDADPELTVSINGLLPGDDASDVFADSNISRAEGEDVGEQYTITPSEFKTREEYGYYKVIYTTGRLTITRARATVKADDVEKVAGTEDHLTATVSGLRNGDAESVIEYTLSRPDNIDTNPDRERSGEHEVVASGEETQGNYTVEFENGTLTIKKLTITFMNGEVEERTSELELNGSLSESELVDVDREGCDFEGWYRPAEDGTERVTTETTFSTDTVLSARLTVTVNFVADGTDDPEPMVLDEGAEINTIPPISKEGYRFDGWYRNAEFTGERVVGSDTFNRHTTLYAKFVEQVTVDFEVERVNVDGDTADEVGKPINIDRGTSLTESDYPEVTVPEGYRFRGWYVGETQVDAEGADYRFDADATVTARVVLQTTVTYVAEQDDGTLYTYVTDEGDVNRRVDFPNEPTLPVDGSDPALADFKGWYDGDTKVSDHFSASTDMTLNARYTVTVNFLVKNADYSDVTSETLVKIGKGAEIDDKLLNAPVMPGYKFNGWFTMDEDGKPSDTQVLTESVFNAHTAVVAKFTKQVTVVFDTDGIRHEFVCDAGDTIELLENPVKAGTRFDGWFVAGENGRRVTNAEGITDQDGNLVDLNDDPLPEGAEAVRMLKATEDVTLEAHFIDQITVEFIVVHPETRSSSTNYPSLNSEAKFTLDKTQDGQPVKADFYDHIPVVSGYYFLGWYYIRDTGISTSDYNPPTDKDKFVIPNDVEKGKVYEIDDEHPAFVRDETTADKYPTFTEDTILVAKFAKEVTITFRFENESGLDEVEIKDRCLVGTLLSDYYLPLEEPPAEPGQKSAYRENYRIEWYRGVTKAEPDYVITEGDDNAVYDARYIEQVTATFLGEDGQPIDDENGKEIEPVTIDIDTELGELPTVAATIGDGDDAYYFMGWFDDAGKQYDATTILTDNVTLTAKYGYKVKFLVEEDDEWRLERFIAPGDTLGWLPNAPFRAGESFRNWTLEGEVVSTGHAVSQNETIIGHYDSISIFEVEIRYVINGETEPTDTKIITIDSAAAKANPAEVDSPSSFRKSNGSEDVNYYPVVQQLLISSNGNKLTVPTEAENAGVTLDVPDQADPQHVIITVPYKTADAEYTVYYKLLKLDPSDPDGDGRYADDQYVIIDGATEVNLPAVDGAQVSPEVKDFSYAEFERKTSGIVKKNVDNVYTVYYKRNRFKLTYDVQGGDSMNPVSGLYGKVIDLSIPRTRAGYTFEGWYRTVVTNGSTITYEDKVTTDSIVLNDDITLYAKWTTHNVNYTIKYMLEKYDNEHGKTEWVYDSSITRTGAIGDTVTAASAPNLSGKNGYEKDLDLTEHPDSSIEIKADGSSVLYVYYKLIEYTLVFNINRNTGRIRMSGETYSGSDYQIKNVVLGQDVSKYWPSTSSEIYANDRFFGGWTGSGSTYITKRYELIWDNVKNADSNHVMTFTATWDNESHNRNAKYWLQQPDGTYEVEEDFTQIGLNTSNLGAKDIDGYSKHNGTPPGYPQSGDVITAVTQSNNGSYVRDDNRIGGNNRTYYEYEGHLYRSRRNNGDGSLTRYNVTFTFTYNFYYDRAKYRIEYKYKNEDSIINLKTINNIYYEANINTSTYDYVPNRPDTEPMESTWGGWYTDETLKTKYGFDRMPANNLELYAMWVKPTYTVTFYADEVDHDNGKAFAVVDGVVHGEPTGQVGKPDERPHDEFLYWMADNEEFFPETTRIEKDTIVVGHWESKEITRYRVRYVEEDSLGNQTQLEGMPERVVRGLWHLGDSVKEIAPYITGYKGQSGEEGEMIADSGEKTLKLSYDDNQNIITFVYSKKPEHLYYTVKYVLYSDPDIEVAEPKGTVTFDGDENKYVKVDGNYFSVTEMAAKPTVPGYEGYRPLKSTDTLVLGADRTKNVLTFEYTNGARFRVSWLDMEGDAVVEKGVARKTSETYHEVGDIYNVDTTVVGYALDSARTVVTKNGAPTTEGGDELRFEVNDITDVYDITLYYKKDLTILARSKVGQYNGRPLEWPQDPAVDVDKKVSLVGLKPTHALTAVVVTGSQTNVDKSSCDVDEDSIQIDGLKNGLEPSDFYNINCLPGSLIVTRANVVISVEPDRWTGNVYNGETWPTGFTNGEKAIDDYVIINNEVYKEQYLEEIWSNLIQNLKQYGETHEHDEHEYEEVSDALIGKYEIVTVDGKEKKVALTKRPGLIILSKKDAGDYYLESDVFHDAVMQALDDLAVLAPESKNNYNVIPYVRECRLQINPVSLAIKTEAGRQPYTGTPLTKKGLTVTVNGSKTIEPSGDNYTLVEGDTVTIRATGSQTHPGTSQNVYEINWGTVKQENYTLSEDLGELEVLPRPIIVEAQTSYKAFGTADDPAFAVRVYSAKYVEKVGENGEPVLDENGNPVLETVRDGEEIPADLTRWGTGDSYTLQLKDSDRGYTENLSITITREGNELPGTYAITPAWADDAVQNFNVTFVDGKLSICVARVSNDKGATWTYHQWLGNDDPVHTESGYNPEMDDPSRQGAFDKAKALGGNVIVETLSSNEAFEENDILDRYVLGKQISLGDDDQLTSLTLCTTTGADFTSVVSRGYNGASLFATKCALTLENITLDGKKIEHESNSDGGLVHVLQGGSLNVKKDATLRNSTTSAKGGAVYVAGEMRINAGGSITSNTAAEGGNAMFVEDDCTLTMTGGSITGNDNDTGYAVEVGGAGAKLIFSGEAVVYDNLNDEDQHNVYLNYDAVDIINAAGLKMSGDKGAKIGVYVEDTAVAVAPEDGELFKRRGGVLNRFGTYADKANLKAFYNDRNGLRGSDRGADEIIWVQPVTVEVRYMASLKDYENMPERALNAYLMSPGYYMVLTTFEYVPSLGDSKISYNNETDDLQENGFTIDQIEEDIHANYGTSTRKWGSAATDSMVFWRGYAEKEDEFEKYVESLRSDSDDKSANYGMWCFDKNGDPAVDNTAPVGTEKLVLYYTEPAYITIESDCGLDMDDGVQMMVMLPGYKRASGDTTSYVDPGFNALLGGDSAAASILDCAYVEKIEGAEQTKSYERVKQEDLSLNDGETVKLMIPGAVGAMYWTNGGFKDVIPEVSIVSVDRTGGTLASDENPITLDTDSEEEYRSVAKPALPTSKANAYSYHLYGGLTTNTLLHFGEAYICKITDANDNLLRVDSKIQAFKSLEEGFKAYDKNELTDYKTKDGTSAKPAYIKMLVEDYDLKLSKLGSAYENDYSILAPGGKPVILTTAASTDGELPGPYRGTAETRCIIKRGVSETSMFSVPANATLTTKDIVFDGGAVIENGISESGEVSTNGGIITSAGSLNIGEATTMQNTAVKTVAKDNPMHGGAVYVSSGEFSISGTPNKHVAFNNCYANSDGDKEASGGAVYTVNTKAIEATYADFSYCTSNNVGAINIEKADTVFNHCTFTSCTSSVFGDGYGAGALRSAAGSLTIEDCEFTGCKCNSQGGAVFHKGSANFTATRCKFTNCSAGEITNTNTKSAGALEAQAGQVNLTDCVFKACNSTRSAGAVNVWNTKSEVEVTRCTFENCYANLNTADTKQGYGGALRSNGVKNTITDSTFKNCSATWGGALGFDNTANTTIEVTQDFINAGKVCFDECVAIRMGGAVYLDKGTLTINGGTMRGCSSPIGGGVYLGGDENSKFSMAGGTITSCTARTKTGIANSGSGGGVYLGGGTFTMTGGKITDCNAYNNGGGVCLNAAEAFFYLKGGTISKCNSQALGGGMYQGGGTFEFTDGEINKCCAKAGGGAYINASEAVTISKDGVAIKDCKAVNVHVDSATDEFTTDDAHVAENEGGGLYQNGGELTITAASISNCSAYDGGGIYLDNSSGNNTRLNIGANGQTSVGAIGDCTAINNGGGIFLRAGELNVYTGFAIQRNSSTNGGGIYQGGGELIIHDGGIKSNRATNNGGGIYLGGGVFTLEDGEVGGLNADDSPNGGNEAKRGGGLFVADGTGANEEDCTTASIKGGLLGGNHATEVAGGGGIAIGGPNVRLYFEGSIQVWGNTMVPSPDYPEQTSCDVCLSVHSNEIIHTTEVGLNEESHIGVYVPDWRVETGDDAGKWLHQELHGTAGLPFGTFDSTENGYGDNCLNRFINNRSGTAYQGYEYYYGVRKPDGEDEASEYGPHRIYWADYICEITDAEGNLLFTNNKATAPALYQYLGQYGAFEALENSEKFYYSNGSEYTGADYDVRMLVLGYDLRWSAPVPVPNRGIIKLMMAAKRDNCLPEKVRRRYDANNGITTINRGACTDSMFTTSANSNFIIESVTLDGGATYEDETWDNPVHVDGAFINASGNVTLGNKVLLRNSYNTKSGDKGGNGGAIAYSGPGTLTMGNGMVIDRCRAQNNGALLYVSADNATEDNPVNIEMQEGALWQNCEATNGLIYVNAGVVNLNDGFYNKAGDTDLFNVDGCNATSGGLAYVAGGTLNVIGSVKDFTANNGGAVYASGGVVNLSATIESCKAATNGGGVYIGGGTLNMVQTVENSDAGLGIKGCSAQHGGAIFETGGSTTVKIAVGEISGNTATGYGGGALRMEEGAQAEITATAEIKNNKVVGKYNEMYGAAVYVKNGMLTVSGGEISENSFEGTDKIAYGGAIHLSGVLNSNGKQDESALVMTGGAITGNTVSSSNKEAYGGAISMRGAEATATISGGAITGNSAIATANGKIAYGGAVALLEGAKLTLTGGTINGNSASGGENASGKYGENSRGAGIYVDEKEGTTLEISGAPDFGGTGMDDEGKLIATKTVDGKDVSAGNFITWDDYSSETNGQMNYLIDDKVRQDIYIAEDGGDEPKSIVVAGDLTGDPSTIWVWAEKDAHNKQLRPFAALKEEVRFVAKEEEDDVLPEGAIDAEHLMVFRNAMADSETFNATESWLYGCVEGEEGYVYWNGIAGFRKVILRKVGSGYESLSGAVFTISKGSSAVKGIDIHGNTDVTEFESGDDGVFYIDTMSAGVYVLYEKTQPSGYSGGPYFYLVVDEDVVATSLGADGYSTAEAARQAGNEKMKQLKEERAARAEQEAG